MDPVKGSLSIADSGASESWHSRAERLLEAMHPVFSHDLPNQLVVIQSLANLMELDEKDALSVQAREYLTRLIGAAKRAAGMVGFLKHMARLNRVHEALEEIQLVHLAREIRAELNQQFPGRTIIYDMQWDVTSVRAGRRSLHQALLEVLRCGIEWCAEPAACLRLRAQTRGADVELDLAVAPRNISDLPQSPVIRHDRPTPENRLELRLAQELVAGWGGILEVLPTSPNFLVRLLIPCHA